MTRTITTGLAVVLLTTTGILAQPPLIGTQQAETARRLINSSELVNKAWGVYIAGQLHRADFKPLLLEQFQFASTLRGAKFASEEYAFVAVVFDAAIQSNVEIPSAVLEPFVERWLDPVLILAAHSRDSDRLLMSVRGDQSRDVVWLTANNLLWGRRSNAWYGAMLAEIHFTHHFVVWDSDDTEKAEGGVGRAGCGDGIASMPKGFPPVALYALGNQGGKEEVVLAPGPITSFYRRGVVPTDKETGRGSCFGGLDRAAIRIGYLAQMRHEPPEAMERLVHGKTKIPYSTPEAFQAAVDQSLQSQEEGIRALLQSIEKFDHLSPRAPSLHLQIVPEVIDNRRKAVDLLPGIAPREIRLPLAESLPK